MEFPEGLRMYLKLILDVAHECRPLQVIQRSFRRKKVGPRRFLMG